MNLRETIVALVVVGSMVGIVFVLTSRPPRDSTDAPGTRSGMKLHYDAATGCEYLSIYHGGITPRMDRDGRHICRSNTP